MQKLTTLLRKDWLRCLVLAVIGIAVRSPALQGPRIWDDQYLCIQNPFIKSPLLLLETFRHYLFLDGFSAHYRPVQNISFMVDYFFWNTDAWGFHLTNVLLHAGSGILIYFLVRRIFASLWFPSVRGVVALRALRFAPALSFASFFVALLWLVHPVHSAAVDYISGRADSLACVFATAAWLLFIRGNERKRSTYRRAYYILAAFAALLALLSREVAAVWMLLFIMHLVFVERNLGRRFRLASIICCLLIATAYGALRQLPERRTGPGPSADWTKPMQAVLMMRALGDYTRLMLMPENLHMERSVFDGDEFASNRAWRQSADMEYLSVLGLVGAGLLALGCCWRGRGQSARIFGASWFFLAYLPTSNLLPLNATVAEHWLYLPSVGFLIFVAGCVLDMPSRFRHVAVSASCFAVIALGARSAIRSSDWADERTFFERTLAAGGTSTRVTVNLGQVYARNGNYKAAERLFRSALSAMPDYPIARNGLADVLFHQGKKAESEAILSASAKAASQASKDYPRTWIATLSLAHIQHDNKNNDAALATVDKARAEYPHTWEIISFEAELLRETKGADAALQLVQDFARAHWWHFGASMALGQLYTEKGDVEQAEVALRHASWLDIHDAEALDLVAMIRFRQNRLDEAVSTQRRAIGRQPDQPRQYMMLSNFLAKMGRTSEAEATVAQVRQLRLAAESQPVLN
jgi:tetratricopeptide (TPR) repeat protein